MGRQELPAGGLVGSATTATSGSTGRPRAPNSGQPPRAARVHDGGNWIEVLVELDGEAATSEVAADEREQQLPPWPIRRVMAGMKRCPLPDAKELTIVFGGLLADEPDPRVETDTDVLMAMQEALDGGPPLFLVAEGDGLSPHYGRITVGRGQARLLLWEGGGSVCDETVAATSTEQVLGAASARARRLVEAYPTRPDIEAELAELLGAPAEPWGADPTRRCKKHRRSPRPPSAAPVVGPSARRRRPPPNGSVRSPPVRSTPG